MTAEQKAPESLKGRTASGSRFPISRKMLLGYLPLTLFMILISGYVLSYLERFSRVNEEIIRRDIPLLEATNKMTDALLSQELYRRRYIILRSPDMISLFWKNGEEFSRYARKAISLWKDKDLSLSNILLLHERYGTLFMESTKFEDSSGLRKDWEEDVARVHKNILGLIDEVTYTIHREQNRQLISMSETAGQAFRVTAGLCLLAILVGIGTSTVVTRTISRSVRMLQKSAAQIAAGNFDVSPEIGTGDELEDLASDFGDMAKRLKRLEEMYLDANPLTRLPGNIAIENVLNKRLRSSVPTAFCLVDLDEFKAFNDRYGYARGSEVIKEVARLLGGVAQRYGAAEDFIGHIGGDDFVIITSLQRFETLCIQLISAFDARIPDFYEREDREKGHIISRTRQGVVMSFPIMTMSIAVVTNQNRALTNHIETGEIAAEIKEYAKRLPGSNFVVDRRLESRQEGEGESNIVPLRQKNPERAS